MKMPKSERRRLRESGSTTVEFSFVFLPLMAFILMTMDLVWILFGWACIQEAAREAVRFGITGSVTTGLDNSIRQVVRNYSFGFVSPSDATTTSNNSNSRIQVQYFAPTTFTELTGKSGATAGGNVLRVTIKNIPIGTFGPIFRTWTPITLSASSADVMEASLTPPAE